MKRVKLKKNNKQNLPKKCAKDLLEVLRQEDDDE